MIETNRIEFKERLTRDLLSQEEFFAGISVPRNKEVMRVFRDVRMGEGLGSGMRLVMKRYTKEVFEFLPHFLRINVLYCSQQVETTLKTTLKTNLKTTPKTTRKTTPKTTQETTQEKILLILNKHPETPLGEVAKMVGVTFDTVRYHIKNLRAKGIVVHKGPNKGGYWLVLHQPKNR